MCKPEGLNTFEKLQFHFTGPPIYTRKAISELESSAEFLKVFPPQFQLQETWGVTRISSPERLDEPHFILSSHREGKIWGSNPQIKDYIHLSIL